jgi:hypothetical protein
VEYKGNGKDKCKISPAHAIKARRGSRCINSLIHKLGTIRKQAKLKFPEVKQCDVLECKNADMKKKRQTMYV